MLSEFDKETKNYKKVFIEKNKSPKEKRIYKKFKFINDFNFEEVKQAYKIFSGEEK